MNANDLAFAERTIHLASDYVAGRALDGVDVDLCAVWQKMYCALAPLPAAEREVKIAQIEQVMHAPTAH